MKIKQCLDEAKRDMRNTHFVRDIQRDYGVTTVFVTHDQRMALTMSDRVALLRAKATQTASPVQKAACTGSSVQWL